MWDKFGALATVIALFLAASLVPDQPVCGVRNSRFFLVSAGFTIMTIESLRTGSAWSRVGSVRKNKNPVLYWFSVTMFVGLSLVFLLGGIISSVKGH
jgi:hypothetical protein